MCCSTLRFRTRCAAERHALVRLLTRRPCQEVRFLFPVLPLFNMCAAAALARLYASRCDCPVRLAGRLSLVPHRRKSATRMLFFLAGASLVAASVAAKAVMTWAAHWNYPVRRWLAHGQASGDGELRAGWLGFDFAVQERCERLQRKQGVVQRARRCASGNERRVSIRGAGASCMRRVARRRVSNASSRRRALLSRRRRD